MTERGEKPGRARWWIVGLVGIVSFASGGWLLNGFASSPKLSGEQLFERVLGAVSSYYVDSLPNDSLLHKAAAGLLAELHDPYTTLVEGEAFRELTVQTTGNYGGLGIQIDVRDGWITVVAPLPDTPAQKVGIEAGDQIVSLNGKSIEGLKQDDAVRTLRGEPGSEAKLQVRRPGIPQLLEFSIVREMIHFRSVRPGTMLGEGIGLVQLASVSETSTEELHEEIERLRKEGMKRLILDLRQNPGGLLDQGIAVSSLFLDRGQQVVSTRGRADGMSRTFGSERNQPWPEMPVTVLVNQWTASAAEIIAGALQDNDRAAIIGTPTFGKGLVQSLFRLDDTRALKLTTARWYTPSGRSIQRQSSSEEDQVRTVESIAAGTDDVRFDSLPTYQTFGGRTVKGGGGIVPDRIVRSDTTTPGERAFIRALGGNVAGYRDALTSTALELKQRRTVSSESFAVTPEMLESVYQRLESKGIVLGEVERAGGADLVSDQLGYEITRYVFGQQAELRRRSMDDSQVQEAVSMLRRSDDARSLIAQLGQE